MALAGEAGAAKVVRLQVGAAFHSELMKPVQARMAEAMADVTWSDPQTPLVANFSGEILTTGEEVHQALIAQIASPVHWVDCVRALVDAGCTTFLELGSGRVVLGEVPVALVDHLDDADRVVADLEWQREDVLRLEAGRLVHDRVETRVVLWIRDDGRLSALEDRSRDALSGRDVPSLDLLAGLAGRHVDDEVAALLVQEEQRAGLGIEQLRRGRHDQLQELFDVQRRVEQSGDLDDPFERRNLVLAFRHLCSFSSRPRLLRLPLT